MERLSYLVCITICIVAIIVTVGILYIELNKEPADEPFVICIFASLVAFFRLLIYVTNHPPEDS